MKNLIDCSQFNRNRTEQIDLEETRLAFILEVFSSNLSWIRNYPGWILVLLSKLQTEFLMVPSLGHDRFYPHSFQLSFISHSNAIYYLYSVKSGSDDKGATKRNIKKLYRCNE